MSKLFFAGGGRQFSTSGGGRQFLSTEGGQGGSAYKKIKPHLRHFFKNWTPALLALRPFFLLKAPLGYQVFKQLETLLDKLGLLLTIIFLPFFNCTKPPLTCSKVSPNNCLKLC